ncbi:single-stranded DNA-binding protein [Streptosporangium sp. CA-135522]|uniref:single-stranded DNA-binding protein n=1 Tax=Streptosporangium sp. CA-135522 TaxID=3240072 RepID=UPI003D9270DD
MDRNEVILVGRLPETARIRSLQSGSTLGAWRLIVRRQQRGRGTRVDTIPCVSFEPEVTVAVADWLPDDMVEVVGSLRRRWWGSEGAKSSGYEVEVRSARRLERRITTVLPGDESTPAQPPAPPRSVRSLVRAGTASVRRAGSDPVVKEEPTGPVDPEPARIVEEAAEETVGTAPISVRRSVEAPSLR